MAFWLQHPPLLREIHALRDEGILRLLIQALLAGGGAGAVIGAFRFCYTWNTEQLTAILHEVELFSFPVVVSIFGILTVLALLAGGIARWEPLLSGSGIPQTALALLGHLPFPWVRLLAGKFVGTLLSLTGGLSVGREGPCIQMGAAVGCGIGTLWHSHPDAMPRYLIAGSAAGMTAAFGAPVAGLLFAFEELHAILSAPLLLFIVIAAGSAWIVVDGFWGFGLVFTFHTPLTLPWTHYWILIVLGPLTAILGVLYNKILMAAIDSYSRWKIPLPLKALLPFWCSGVLLFLYPQVLAGTGFSIPQLAELPLTFAGFAGLLAVKIIFSAISFGSGVPGGLLMPMLCAGAMFGSCVSSACTALDLMPAAQSACLMSLCMGAMFAATVRSPFTGAALVIEMTGAWALAPAMLITTVSAAFTANWLGSPPVYDSLKQRILDAHDEAKSHGNVKQQPAEGNSSEEHASKR